MQPLATPSPDSGPWLQGFRALGLRPSPEAVGTEGQSQRSEVAPNSLLSCRPRGSAQLGVLGHQ